MKKLLVAALLLSAGLVSAAIRPPSKPQPAAPSAEAKTVAKNSGESWSGRFALYKAMIRWLSVSRKDAYEEFQSGAYALLQRAVTDEVPDALCDYGILLMNGIFFEKDLKGGYAEIVKAAEKGSDLAKRIVKEVGR